MIRFAAGSEGHIVSILEEISRMGLVILTSTKIFLFFQPTSPLLEVKFIAREYKRRRPATVVPYGYGPSCLYAPGSAFWGFPHKKGYIVS